MRRALVAAGAAAITLLAAACGSSSASSSSSSGSVTLRLGFLENITHATALVGIKEGYFTKDLGKGVTLKLYPFSTGTEEATALLAGQLDAAYAGPNPAIKTGQTSDGQPSRLLSPAPGSQAMAALGREAHQGHLGRCFRRRRARGEEGHHASLAAQGPEAGHPLAGEHPGRVAALLAQAAGADVVAHWRRRSADHAEHAYFGCRPTRPMLSRCRAP